MLNIIINGDIIWANIVLNVVRNLKTTRSSAVTVEQRNQNQRYQKHGIVAVDRQESRETSVVTVERREGNSYDI